jgi:hypothetical protein
VKIHIDKIETAPAHALSLREVKLVLRTVPPAWVEGLAEVRLSNSLEHCRPYAFFSRYHGCLTIYSRRGTKQQALVAVLSALAATSLGIRGFGRRPSEANRRRVNNVIQRFVDELWPEIAPRTKRGWWGHPVPTSRDRA